MKTLELLYNNLGVDDPATAALHIAIGSNCPVDCATIHEQNSLVF